MCEPVSTTSDSRGLLSGDFIHDDVRPLVGCFPVGCPSLKTDSQRGNPDPDLDLDPDPGLDPGPDPGPASTSTPTALCFRPVHP